MGELSQSVPCLPVFYTFGTDEGDDTRPVLGHTPVERPTCITRHNRDAPRRRTSLGALTDSSLENVAQQRYCWNQTGFSQLI